MADGFRLRVCFGKTGRLRYLSHLECARACERAVRRASLPYAVSKGFTPRMRISFGPALPVGTAGTREYYDVLLARFVHPDDAYHALKSASPGNLAPLECGYVLPNGRSLDAAISIAVYELTVEGGTPPEEIERRLARTIRAGTLSVEHKGKQRFFDLAEALPKEPEVESSPSGARVRIWIRTGEHGSLRPEALVSAACGNDARTVVDRTDLLIEHEGAWIRPL